MLNAVHTASSRDLERAGVLNIGGRCCVGNIGLDLLRQSGGVVMDFSRMTLLLR
jgi:hypothetical protein